MKQKKIEMTSRLLFIFCIFAQTIQSRAMDIVSIQGNDTSINLAGLNFVETKTFLDAGTANPVKAIQLYDGLGRPSVHADNGLNSDGTFVYSKLEYDTNGRQSKSWLPCTNAFQNFSTNPNMRVLTFSMYGDGNAYSRTTYDVLGRPVFVSTPGEQWHSHNKGKTMRYVVNVSSEDAVRHFIPDSDNDSGISEGEPYTASSLTGEETVDEDSVATMVFRDLAGNVVLERRNGSNDTYYVYNNLGQLRFVLPPMCTNPADTMQLKRYAYEYRYDAKGRCIWKRLPGCDPERYWYDKYGRISFIQNERLKSHFQFRFYLYDGLNRLAVQGITSDTIGKTSKNYVAKVVFDPNNSSVGNTGYNFAGTGTILLPTVEIANYYDGYDFLSLQSVQNVLNGQNFTKSNPSCATTLQTGSLTATSDGHFLCNVFYYDEKGQLIDSRQTLLNGTVMTGTTTYSFTGQPLQTVTSLRMGYMTPTVTETYTYDSKSDKLRSATLSFGNGAIPVSGITYDDLGRVQTKDYHGGSIRTSYSYDLHGWVTELTSTKANGTRLFQEDIHYADNSATNCYNGNISMVRWLSGDNPMGQNICNGYTYTYDGMNRLTGASFGMGNIGQPGLSTFNDMGTVEYSYNANSSLTGMTRYGRKDVGYGVIDNLMYSYNGNQLNDIYDAVSNQHYDGAFEFRNNAVPVPLGAPEYGYDGCGAMTYDLNRGIVKIDYDLLGNPKRIQFSNGNVTEYVYSADGRRLQTTHRTAVSGISVGIGQEHTLTSQETLSTGTTYYMDKFLYSSNGTLRYHFADGYTEGNGASYFHYYIRDHQGNNRVVAKYDGTIEQTTHYYPYGGILSQSTNQGFQKFKYNGKEFDTMHGLNMYDYGARQQDPAVGMFTSMDPLCEKYYNVNPYMYCAGNPVRYVDPTGCDTLSFQMGENNYAAFTGRVEAKGNDVGQIVDGKGNVIYTFNFASPDDADHFYIEKVDIEKYCGEKSNEAMFGVQVYTRKQLEKCLNEVPGLLRLSGIMKYVFAALESKGGKMDFVTSVNLIDEHRAYLPLDGSDIAHNPWNFGNYLWGMAMRKLGIPYSHAAMGAHIQNYFGSDIGKGQLDSPDDQRSILLGYHNYINYSKIKKIYEMFK